ncbi:MAG: transposase [Planctomycetales bacterium]|nr:transposase [Planctomycetales bacterium]
MTALLPCRGWSGDSQSWYGGKCLMAMGKRKRWQESLFIMADELPRSAGHPFYAKLNELLGEAGFDRWIEKRCEQYYERKEKRGRPSIPPGVYFRMLLVGYFEGIDSQRGIAWRCADSLSLRQFLGVPLSEQTPDHSSMTNTRRRLPPEVFTEVFQFVLGIAREQKLVSGKTVGVDSTTLEANAAMKSIIRRDTGEDWQQYVTRLMREEGVIDAEDQPTDEEIRRYDKKRKDKKVSNDEWVSRTDCDSRITQMKDGRTHLAYKAEHVVDLDQDLVLAAEIRPADHADMHTLVDSVMEAQVHLQEAGCEQRIAEVAADKGYHAAATLELAESLSLRTYIPEPQRKHTSRWTDKPPEYRRAVSENRRRLKRAKSKRLQRKRSELCERTFAHICDSGGMRRSWLRGLVDVTKRYVIAAAAHNLGRILRALFGIGKPRALQGRGGLAALVYLAILPVLFRIEYYVARLEPNIARFTATHGRWTAHWKMA